MISCLGTSIVTTRKSIRTILSTMGMRKMMPGPFAPCNLPSRKITPRSYSRRMRMDCGRMKIARTTRMMTKGAVLPNMLIIPVMSCSIMFLRFLVFWFHFQSQTVDADNFNRLAGLHRCIADGVPMFAFDKHLAALRVNPRLRAHRPAEHRFRAGADGFELRADALADDEDEKQRRHHRARNDPAQRQAVARPGVAEQHQRAQEK